MLTVTLSDAQADLAAIIQRAQRERIVIERDGQPVAILTGIEFYDDEDLATAHSPEFWQMIEGRRIQGRSVPLSEVRARLDQLPD